MKKPSIPLGLVFSQSGPYAMMAGEMRKSALMAVDEINASDAFDFVFAPHLRDPGGVVAGYHTACADLIREEQVDHIVGCYTSASRKQVIPIVERTERLLWHPARYEGFESSDNVIYVGAAPNQHVVSGPIKFVLSDAGHMAGVISPPGTKYGHWANDELPSSPDEWFGGATPNQGSWWPVWDQWITQLDSGRVPAREPGGGKLTIIEDAPGSYVRVSSAA